MLPEVSSTTIVLVGKFDISDFLPRTLVMTKVLRSEELIDIELIAYVPSQILDYDLPWGKVTVTPQQLVVKAEETPHVTASDFIRSALANASEAVKVVAMGINFEGHFKLEYAYQRNKIGTRLVPPSAWGAWGEEVQKQIDTAVDGKLHGGVVNAVLRKARVNDDGMFGHVEVRVQPSSKFPETGIHMAVNDHYQFDRKNSYSLEQLERSDIVDRKPQLMLVLEKRFDESIALSRKIMSGILGGA